MFYRGRVESYSCSVAVDERVIATRRWQIQVASMETYERFIMKRSPHQGKSQMHRLEISV